MPPTVDVTLAVAEPHRVRHGTNGGRVAAVLAVLVVAALALAPYIAGSATLRLLIEIFYYLALATLWNFLAGYAGLVSVGQQAFVGLGGYALFAACLHLGINPLLCLPLAGIAAGVFAIPTALIVFRLRGAYFAIGTWVVAEVYRLVFAQFGALGGGSGTSLPASVVKTIAVGRELRESLVYWSALAVIVAILVLVYLLLRSRWGLALASIRDNEAAAESLGVDNFRTKLLVYVVTAAVTGVVGALIFLQKLRISPDAAFSINDWTAFVIFIVVIGGIGRLEGPIIGTLVFFLLRQFLSDLGAWYLMMLGATAVLVMLLEPKGLWGFFAERYGLEVFPLQRRLKSPSEQELRK